MAYRIVVNEDSWDYWQALVQHTEGEVACFGYCTIIPEDQEVYVDTLFIVPQEADKSQVDFVTAGLPYAIEKAIADDRLDDLHFCIHSHGNLNTFWSSTDDDMIRKMGSTAEWFVSAVSNRKGENRGRIDLYDVAPLHTQITLDDLKVVSERTLVIQGQAEADFAKFVSKPVYVKPATGTGVGFVKNEPPKADVVEGTVSELTPFVYDGVRYWLDEEGHVVHEELLGGMSIPDDEEYGWSWAQVGGIDELTDEDRKALMELMF